MVLAAGEFLELKLGAKASAFIREIAARVPIIDFIVSNVFSILFLLVGMLEYRIRKIDGTSFVFELCKEVFMQTVCPECATSV